jgi:hypothetical protein
MKLLGLSLLEFLEGPLICWQTSFPISKESVWFISIHAIAMATYLRSYVFVALIIILSFLQYHHPLLLEAARACNSKIASILDTFEKDAKHFFFGTPNLDPLF